MSSLTLYKCFKRSSMVDLTFNLELFLLGLLFVVSVSGNVDNELLSLKHLQKRQEYEDYRVCARNFEIHQDKIIRTDESKKMGAKYLNGKDVTSKEECEKLCCETPNCNIFVLEEKVFNQQQGTCYLFDCGTPESFKCKFTRHHNYSSAVLLVNRPQMQLEDEIQYSQHERELTNLRSSDIDGKKSKNCLYNTAVVGGSDESNAVKDSSKDSSGITDEYTNNAYKKSSKCSRYQFECRTSGECIAIYNACDGIPQCADHSDEDIELGCPTSAPLISSMKVDSKGPSVDKKQMEVDSPLKLAETVNENSAQSSFDQNLFLRQQPELLEQQQIPLHQQVMLPQQQLQFNRQMTMNQWQMKMNPQYYDGTSTNNELPMNDNYSPVVNSNIAATNIMNARKLQQQAAMVAVPPQLNMVTSREGKTNNGAAFPNSNKWMPKNGDDIRVINSNYGSLHNFNHKQSEINVPYSYGEYSNIPLQTPYDMYNRDSAGINRYPQSLNQWHNKFNNMQSNLDAKITEGKTLGNHNSSMRPEYYDGEADGLNKKRIETVQSSQNQTRISKDIRTKPVDGKTSTLKTTVQKSTNVNKTTTVSLKQSTASDSVTTTTIEMKKAGTDATTAENKSAKAKVEESNSHRKLEKQLSAELSDVQEQLLNSNEIQDGYTDQPSGAFVSLTLGVCVTAIMVFVVGCRLEVLRKRIRRGGKLPYAHDADFLVNGMYL